MADQITMFIFNLIFGLQYRSLCRYCPIYVLHTTTNVPWQCICVPLHTAHENHITIRINKNSNINFVFLFKRGTKL